MLRLMTPAGEITEIPYPQRLADHLRLRLDYATVLRPGLLLVQTGKPPGRGEFLLLQGERVRRIWQNDGGFLEKIAASPDGCKLAFTSFWRKRIFLFLPETPNTVKIIDVCQAK